MTTKNIFIYLFATSLVLIAVNSCKRDQELMLDTETSIKLKWNKGYETETKLKVETGLLWTLSSLGASLPKGSFANAIEWKNNIISVDFGKVGFNDNALQKITLLLQIIKKSNEYQRNNSFDIGRFVMLTICSSNHYYSIVGFKKTLSDFKKNQKFDLKNGLVNRSSISTNNRIIYMPDTNETNYTNTKYISTECSSNLMSGQCNALESEVFELQANGQFSFGVYDVDGKLVSESKGGAGKISKCYWCHEIYIQTLFKSQENVNGYYTDSETKRLIDKRMTLVNQFRNGLMSDLDFTKTYDHTYMELLYITFMEPSAERLASEWNVSVEEVKKKTLNFKTHQNNEFAFLKGQFYDRSDIEKVSPFKSIRVPESAREKSDYEPDLIH